MKERVWLRVGGLFVFGVLTWYGVFCLPWHFPPMRWVASDSYYAGFSNAGALFALLLAAMVVRVCFTTRSDILPGLQSRPEGLWKRHIVAGFVPSLVPLFVGAVLTQHVVLLTDWTYFLPKLLQLMQGKHLYTDIEFAYGPLQLYGPLLLTWFGLKPVWAGFVFWSAEQLLGVWMLFEVVRRLSVARSAKLMIFYCFCLTAPFLLCWAPTPDSLFVRVMLAPYLLLGLERMRAGSPLRYAVIGLSVPFLFACFLETGIGFVIVQLCSAGFDIRAGRLREGLWTIACTLSGVALAAVLFPRHSMAAVLAFGQGGNAVPVVPTFYTLIFLASFLYLASMVPLERSMSANQRSFLHLFLYSAVLLPCAMSGGYGHIYQELPIFLIVLTLLLAEGKPWGPWVAGAVFLVILQTVAIPPFRADRRGYFKQYVPVAFADLAHQTPREPAHLGGEGSAVSIPPLGKFDPAYAQMLRGVAAVQIPFHLDEISGAEYESLAQRTRLDFGYFTDTWDVFGRAQVEQKKAEWDAHPDRPLLVERYRLGATPCPVSATTGRQFPRCEMLSYLGQLLEANYKVERAAYNLVLLVPRQTPE